MTIMRFSNNGNKPLPFITLVPVSLENEAAIIASADGTLFERATRLTKKDYDLNEDQSILEALGTEQGRRIAEAYLEKTKLPRP